MRVWFASRALGYRESVERESTKHGWYEDEALAKSVGGLLRGAPVDPRSREERRLEDLGDDAEIDAGYRPDLNERGALGEHARDQRADLARLLTGLHYPAAREEIGAVAERNAADEATLTRLAQLPDGKFDLFEAIWEATGGQPD